MAGVSIISTKGFFVQYVNRFACRRCSLINLKQWYSM